MVALRLSPRGGGMDSMVYDEVDEVVVGGLTAFGL